MYALRKSKTRNSHAAPPPEEWEVGMSYSELARATDGFCADNLIGSGSFGSVYEGVLPYDGKVVAIKVLNIDQQGASKSFINELNALSSLRHRNLLRIISACSGVDHHGNDFKALVLEFLPNGSLDQWLHPRSDDQRQTKRLSMIQRLDIAIHVACALDYLHHHCDTPIVHCDLKPSNVLLDKDLTAHVSDFGLAKFLLETSEGNKNNQAMSEGLKGSIGYIPPEYGLGGQVSTLGDTYSFGILLLEMFTGKSPTDEVFKDDLSIHKFVKMALPEHVLDIIDPSMIIEQVTQDFGSEEGDVEQRAIAREYSFDSNRTGGIEQCLVSIMEVALSCSMRLPARRVPMNLAVNKLQDIRDSFLNSQNRNRM